jgi:hypothetical protein
MSTEQSPPDLAGAVVYVEAGDRSVAGGRWYVLPDDRVIYERPNGDYVNPAVINAATLRSSPTWRRQ